MDAFPTHFDPDALLAPIPGDAPTGADPREDFSPVSPYLRLRDARSEARAAERRADAAAEGDEAPQADWRSVRTLAAELLATRAKDLEVACWYTEALLRTDGLAGFAVGVTLVARLVETYWDTLHPMPDEEDGMDRRLAPLIGLNGAEGDGTLIQPLRKLMLFERADGTPTAFWQFRQSMEVAGIGDTSRRQQRLAAGTLPFDAIEAEARATAGEWAPPLARTGTTALQAWNALAAAVEQRASVDTPTSRVRELIVEITEIAARYAPRGTLEAVTIAPADTTPPGNPPQAAASSGPIAGREDALRALAEISDYFRRTEPHSPLAYTLAEAVRRARLSWPELLEEIVPDHDNRAAILQRLGIRPGEQAE